jgi:hypothetical protein
MIYATLHEWDEYAFIKGELGKIVHGPQMFINGNVRFDITETGTVYLVLWGWDGKVVTTTLPRTVNPGEWVELDRSSLHLE